MTTEKPQVFGIEAWKSIQKIIADNNEFKVPELEQLEVMRQNEQWSDYEVKVINGYKGKIKYRQIADFLNYKCHDGRKVRTTESVRCKWRRLNDKY